MLRSHGEKLAAMHLLKSKDSFLRALMDSTNQEHLKSSYNSVLQFIVLSRGMIPKTSTSQPGVIYIFGKFGI